MDQGEFVQELGIESPSGGLRPSYEYHSDSRLSHDFLLRGELVQLRFLDSVYNAEYLTMFSPAVRQWLHASLESEQLYLEQQVRAQSVGSTFFFCIFDRMTDQLIGAIEIQRASMRGQLYAWMHEQFWGSGRYQEALALASRAYFTETRAPFFVAHVDVANKRSYHALRKMNFAPAGFCDGPHGKQHVMIMRNPSLFR